MTPETAILLSVLFAQYPGVDQAYADPGVHFEDISEREAKFWCDAPTTLVSKVVAEGELGAWPWRTKPIIYVTCNQAATS